MGHGTAEPTAAIQDRIDALLKEVQKSSDRLERKIKAAQKEHDDAVAKIQSPLNILTKARDAMQEADKPPVSEPAAR